MKRDNQRRPAATTALDASDKFNKMGETIEEKINKLDAELVRHAEQSFGVKFLLPRRELKRLNKSGRGVVEISQTVALYLCFYLDVVYPHEAVMRGYT